MATKDESEAAKAAAEAEKARLELEEYKSAAARAKRDAELRAGAAKAEKEEREARLSAVASLVPDFSKVERGETTVTGEQGLFASPLALRALDAAAVQVAKDIKRQLGDNYRVLITTDPDLVNTDAVYHQTKSGLDELIAAANSLLESEKDEGRRELLETVGSVGVISALAGALPSVLSLISAHRAVTTHALTGDDLLAAMRLAAAMAEGDAGATVFLDDFRVLRPGELDGLLTEVREARHRLVARKLELAPRPPEEGAQEDRSAVIVAELVGSIVGLIDSYLSALFTVPEGAKRSSYTTALLREDLHRGEDRVGHVVLVKACSGSAQQVVDDRPLWFEDKFSTVASMGISFVIAKTQDGKVLGGGIRTASRTISGSIGSTFVIDSVRSPEFQ